VPSPYLVPAAQLLRDVPSSATVTFEAPFDETHEFAPLQFAETDVFAEASVKVDLKLESFSGGLRARGRVSAPWHGICRRCSTPVLGMSEVSVNERFVDDSTTIDDLAYPIENDFIDLARWCTTPSSWICRWRRCVASSARGCAPTAEPTSMTRPATARDPSTRAGLHWMNSVSSMFAPMKPKKRDGSARSVEREDRWPFQAQDQQSQDA